MLESVVRWNAGFDPHIRELRDLVISEKKSAWEEKDASSENSKTIVVILSGLLADLAGDDAALFGELGGVHLECLEGWSTQALNELSEKRDSWWYNYQPPTVGDLISNFLFVSLRRRTLAKLFAQHKQQSVADLGMRDSFLQLLQEQQLELIRAIPPYSGKRSLAVQSDCNKSDAQKTVAT